MTSDTRQVLSWLASAVTYAAKTCWRFSHWLVKQADRIDPETDHHAG